MDIFSDLDPVMPNLTEPILLGINGPYNFKENLGSFEVSFFENITYDTCDTYTFDVIHLNVKISVGNFRTPEELKQLRIHRRRAIKRWKITRKMLNFNRRVMYECRREFANIRKREHGRFVKSVNT